MKTVKLICALYNNNHRKAITELFNSQVYINKELIFISKSDSNHTEDIVSTQGSLYNDFIDRCDINEDEVYIFLTSSARVDNEYFIQNILKQIEVGESYIDSYRAMCVCDGVAIYKGQRFRYDRFSHYSTLPYNNINVKGLTIVENNDNNSNVVLSRLPYKFKDDGTNLRHVDSSTINLFDESIQDVNELINHFTIPNDCSGIIYGKSMSCYTNVISTNDESISLYDAITKSVYDKIILTTNESIYDYSDISSCKTFVLRDDDDGKVVILDTQWAKSNIYDLPTSLEVSRVHRVFSILSKCPSEEGSIIGSFYNKLALKGISLSKDIDPICNIINNVEEDSHILSIIRPTIHDRLGGVSLQYCTDITKAVDTVDVCIYDSSKICTRDVVHSNLVITFSYMYNDINLNKHNTVLLNYPVDNENVTTTCDVTNIDNVIYDGVDTVVDFLEMNLCDHNKYISSDIDKNDKRRDLLSTYQKSFASIQFKDRYSKDALDNIFVFDSNFNPKVFEIAKRKGFMFIPEGCCHYLHIIESSAIYYSDFKDLSRKIKNIDKIDFRYASSVQEKCSPKYFTKALVDHIKSLSENE